MATITVRAIDANGEPLQGNGQGNFISDLAAVAQIIRTRLLLLQGEWWENLNAGTPLFQSVLGGGGSDKDAQASALIFTQSILGAPYVLSVSNVTSGFAKVTRAFQFSAQALTLFGTVTITNIAPGLSASLNH
jgi:hypothetical protein